LFFAEEIPIFLHNCYFKRDRHRGKFADGTYKWLMQDVPGALIVLTCTAFNHALQEWVKNNGQRPEPDSEGKKPWEEHFSRKNDESESAR
jgi:hypothetical protein